MMTSITCKKIGHLEFMKLPANWSSVFKNDAAKLNTSRQSNRYNGGETK